MKQKKLTYLSGKRVVGIFVEKPFPMPPRLLKQVEGVPSTQRKPPHHSQHVLPSTHCCALFHSS
jgi:hypothetical protein